MSVVTPTINRIRHLKNVGVFADIPVGRCPHAFRRYNLVYGFNGCGKTTLSRLLESVADGGLSPNLADGAEFSFELSDGTVASSEAPLNAASRYIAVFSEDFVDRSLTWSAGAARPIIYLGEEQAELARQLTDLEATETKIAPEETLRAAEWSAAGRVLDNHCRDAARVIADQLNLGRRYTATNIRADYDDATLGPHDKIEEEDRRKLKEVILRSDLPARLTDAPALTGGAATQTIVENVLALVVSDIAISALQRRKDALPWISEGLHLHTTEQECLFCGNELTDLRREDLQDALSSGFEKLGDSITEGSASVSSFGEKCRVLQAKINTPDETLPHLAGELRITKKALAATLAAAQAACAEWATVLADKRSKADVCVPLRNRLDQEGSWDEFVARQIAAVNRVVEKHNLAIENFSEEQAEARSRLKRHYLFDGLSRFQEGVASEAAAKQAYDTASTQLSSIRAEIATTRAALKTHGPAARKLNALLASYLGHARITLEAVDEGYRICRSGKPSTKPLSEGEKTAVAFCYFLTALRAEGRRVRDMIVVIDDPISSLDARAMTHVVSTVRRSFSDPTQLFVFTHNLDFMREIKKWLSKRREDGIAEFLFIETGISSDGSRASTLVAMPALIRDYESEYHYLFSMVRALSQDPAGCERFAYLMPNAMRKVLDIFLAFKEPGASGLEPKVDKVLRDYSGLDGERVKAMERLTQLESHSESIGDTTTFSAYTLEQVADAAKCLLEMIEVVDPQHYKAMERLCRA